MKDVDICKQLELIIAHHKLSLSGFANRIGVQRSVMSHIFSGRNKPSLDFVLRVVEAFNDVSLEWLVFGKGQYPSPNISPSYLPPKNSLEKKSIDKIIIIYSDKSFEDYNKADLL